MLPRMRIRDGIHAQRALKLVQACMNHRPLWASRTANDEIHTITPFHFLNVTVEPINKEFDENNTDLKILQAMKSAQSKCLGKLWLFSRITYMESLQGFHNMRRSEKERTLKVGDLVLMKDDWSARSFWPIARVTKLLPDYLGRVRAVMVDKYVPNEINHDLIFEKFGHRSEKRLTTQQRRELTGFFKALEEPQAVRNLVHFELWESDPYVQPQNGSVIADGGKRIPLLRNFTWNVKENYAVPTVDPTNEAFYCYRKQTEEETEKAKDIARKFDLVPDEEQRQQFADVRRLMNV